MCKTGGKGWSKNGKIRFEKKVKNGKIWLNHVWAKQGSLKSLCMYVWHMA